MSGFDNADSAIGKLATLMSMYPDDQVEMTDEEEAARDAEALKIVAEMQETSAVILQEKEKRETPFTNMSGFDNAGSAIGKLATLMSMYPDDQVEMTDEEEAARDAEALKIVAEMQETSAAEKKRVLVVGRNKNVTNEEFDMRDKTEDYKAAEVWSIIQTLMAD